jgi:hypothetical protein
MPGDILIYQTLLLIPTLWFLAMLSFVFALLLWRRGMKPAASCLVALSAPGALGAALTFILTVLYKFKTSVVSMHSNIVLAFLVAAAFPSHIISPIVLYFSSKRYLSNKEDYQVGYGYVFLLLLLLAFAVISHLLVTS